MYPVHPSKLLSVLVGLDKTASDPESILADPIGADNELLAEQLRDVLMDARRAWGSQRELAPDQLT